MTCFSLIAAIDLEGGLGKNNQLLCHLPADLLHFKTLTWGKPMIMGRKTYESIGRPLPGRRNLVLTHQSIDIPGIEIIHSLKDGVLRTAGSEEVMIIGGAAVFHEALVLANRIYLTRIHYRFDADVFFPELDTHWHCVSEQQRLPDEKNKYLLTFSVLERVNA